jgi:hypothetical protein
VKRLGPPTGDGALLRLLAIGHALAGAAVYRGELRSIGQDGILAGVPYRGPKATAFWFMVPSPLLWAIGRLIGKAEEAGDWKAVRDAQRVGLVSASIAVICLPISGFWLWLAISARGLWRTRVPPRPGGWFRRRPGCRKGASSWAVRGRLSRAPDSVEQLTIQWYEPDLPDPALLGVDAVDA